MIWLNENREAIKRENPGISITEISKKAGEKWKLITDKTVLHKINFRIPSFLSIFKNVACPKYSYLISNDCCLHQANQFENW